MKLVDVMSASGLSMYAIVALLLFVAAFVTVVLLLVIPDNTHKHAEIARLPLDDDHPARTASRTGSTNG
ncbi:MAG: cbb3-type cytochrome c oxidase subunit 3 [Gemmatimonadaceae bacterium]|nr:cbb3-type cytochrome c oxidase subunit 3 [Gemmatimonadaceae bacterium]